MRGDELLARLRSSLSHPLPLPAGGQTALRHRRLMELGREDLSLARLAEAHWDAVAILAEDGREPISGAIYGVWASERPGEPMRLDGEGQRLRVSGRKMFCSGAGLVDRALLTVGAPQPFLVDLNLRGQEGVTFDSSSWKTEVFAETRTDTANFLNVPVRPEDIVGDAGWYLRRPGFWHGACGPAACWAGGAAGLLDFALMQSREDAHTLAHLGAMRASVWALEAYLERAGQEIDGSAGDTDAALVRALTVRHLVEERCTDVLRRLGRAYGPYPLAMDEAVSRRYKELELYVRQSHAERDLEGLGRAIRGQSKAQAHA